MPRFVFVHGCNKIDPKLILVSRNMQTVKAKLEALIGNTKTFQEFATIDEPSYDEDGSDEESNENDGDENAQRPIMADEEQEMLHYTLEPSVWNILMKTAGGFTHTCSYYLTIYNVAAIEDADIPKMTGDLHAFFQ
jgi:hypothetical protein